MTKSNFAAIILLPVLSASTSMAQTGTFTYQGRFMDGGTAANGG
jgi:hypothetical protein